MSILRTRDRSSQSQINGFGLRRSGVLKRWPTEAPTFVGNGGGTSSTTTITLSWPTNTRAGDFAVLVVESSGSDATTTPSDWTHFPGSPVVDVADSTGSKLNVLWRVVPSDSPASVSIADAGDHVVGGISVFRNATADALVFATATATKTTASTSATWPDLTTSSPNNLVLLLASRPNASTSAAFSGFANANLTSIATAREQGSTQGNGGGFVLIYGTKATQGAIGTSTATLSSSLTNGYLVIALEPSIALAA